MCFYVSEMRKYNFFNTCKINHYLECMIKGYGRIVSSRKKFHKRVKISTGIINGYSNSAMVTKRF